MSLFKKPQKSAGLSQFHQKHRHSVTAQLQKQRELDFHHRTHSLASTYCSQKNTLRIKSIIPLSMFLSSCCLHASGTKCLTWYWQPWNQYPGHFIYHQSVSRTFHLTSVSNQGISSIISQYPGHFIYHQSVSRTFHLSSVSIQDISSIISQYPGHFKYHWSVSRTCHVSSVSIQGI